MESRSEERRHNQPAMPPTRRRKCRSNSLPHPAAPGNNSMLRCPVQHAIHYPDNELLPRFEPNPVVFDSI